MICPLHRTVYEFNTECPQCNGEGIKVISTEFDKQDRVIDTMRYMNYEFRPDRSRAVLVFDAPKEKIMDPSELMKKKDKYIEYCGVRCLNCEDHNIEGDETNITGGGATQEVHCNVCGSSWTDYYVLDTAVGITICNDHLPKEVS